MNFANPKVLWALLLVPVLYALFERDLRDRARRLESFVANPLWAMIVPELDFQARRLKGLLVLGAVFFLVLAAARPRWGKIEEEVKVSGLDIMLVVDVSNSMEVEDVIPSRLKKMRHLLKSAIARMEGDRVGVVAFAASNWIASPLTTDVQYIGELLEDLGPKSVVNQGTDIGLALETGLNSLTRAAEDPQSASGEDNDGVDLGTKVLILVSDGEDQEEKAMEIASKLKDQGVRLYVFGVGTEKGGPIPVRDGQGQLSGYKRDRAGAPVVSTFKPDALRQLADSAGGRYWSASADESELDELMEDLNGLERGEGTERKIVTWQERFQLPLALGVVLLLVEMGFASTKRRSKRSPMISTAGHRALAGVFLFALLFGHSNLAFGGSSPGFQAWMHNREGIKNLSDGKAAEAIQSFGQAQATDPDQPVLRFNQGTAQLIQGDSSSATAALDDAAREAEAKGEDGVAAYSRFNAAVALEKENKLDEAAAQYLEAIRLSKTQAASRNLGESLAARTESDARRNLEILFRKREQQKQQQKQNQENQQQQNQQQDQQQKNQQQQQDQQKNQDQNQQGQQKDEPKKKDQEQGKDQQQQQQQGQAKETSAAEKKRFQSDLLSEEDANRLMGDLASRERELRARLNRQKGQPSSPGRDW